MGVSVLVFSLWLLCPCMCFEVHVHTFLLDVYLSALAVYNVCVCSTLVKIKYMQISFQSTKQDEEQEEARFSSF